MKRTTKIDRVNEKKTEKTTTDSLSLDYKNFLTAKRVIITQGKVSVGVSTLLAKNFELFSQAYFKLKTNEFLTERDEMIALATCLNPHHQVMLKALIANEARLTNNSERAEQFWLTVEDKTNYFQKKYQSFMTQLQEEIDNNNYRSSVQYLMLEFPYPELAEVINMAKTEPYKEKYIRGCDYLKNNHQIIIQPRQFRQNSQVFGSNLNSFYEIIFEGQKAIAAYPQAFQDKFSLFLAEAESSLLPDRSKLRGIVASKIISIYLSDEKNDARIAPIHNQITCYLQSVPLELCLSYIKVKDEPPQKYISEKVFQLICSCIELYKQSNRQNSDFFAIQNIEPKSGTLTLDTPVTEKLRSNSTIELKEQTKASKDLGKKDNGLHRFFSQLPLVKRNDEPSLVISEPTYLFGSMEPSSAKSQIGPDQQKTSKAAIASPSSNDLKKNSPAVKEVNLNAKNDKENNYTHTGQDLDVPSANKSADFLKKKAFVENLFNKRNPNFQEQSHPKSSNQNAPN
ncbi:Uncharacterised protein [Legionella steigerwaltii]|uniref:Uncharacterized protein n=1 Tax=Legionella steigerwaltii TaxID=460 RepID=A0A378L5V9_9GAMM|nr:hypothetical protein [Legionella steigerwaltii]KTD72047.1 hypothetical protein Lstg_2665 [Legionella steigerwaltii]STY22455.1 Uncharacterised protein [Legionella steigerwaltii]